MAVKIGFIGYLFMVVSFISAAGLIMMSYKVFNDLDVMYLSGLFSTGLALTLILMWYFLIIEKKG